MVYFDIVMDPSKLACRICLSAVNRKHSTALFTATGLSQAWPSRIHDLLCIEVTKDDGLPSHICKSCRGKLVTIEVKLHSLRALAQESLRKLQDERKGERKRSKDTSGALGVSPSTANVRPPAKRQYGVPRRCLFLNDADSSTGDMKQINTNIALKYSRYYSGNTAEGEHVLVDQPPLMVADS